MHNLIAGFDNLLSSQVTLQAVSALGTCYWFSL